jgi:hypothetical protein
VFLKDKANILTEHSPHDYIIDIIEGKEPPYSPLYNILEKELTILYKYLNKALALR